MRIIPVIIWSLLISVLVSYVLSSMTDTILKLQDILILGVVFAIFVLIIGNIKVNLEKS